MKMLFITPRVDKNHDILGFIHRWIEEFAKYYETLYVISPNVGEYDLPKNVVVIDAGGRNRVVKALKLFFYSFKYTHKSDAVFCHMYVEFVLFSWLPTRVWGKKLFMWYVHKNVGLLLKLAHFLVDGVFTASEKSFRIDSKKKFVVGHGIDTNFFKPLSHIKKEKKVVSVGRISKVKRYEAIVESLKEYLRSSYVLEVVGPVYDEEYYSYLINQANKEKINVVFKDSVPYINMPLVYNSAMVFISASSTGSVDKAVLESMACGVPVLVSNEAFLDVFDEHLISTCYFSNKDELKKKFEHLISLSDKELYLVGMSLRKIVERDHNLHVLAERVYFTISKFL